MNDVKNSQNQGNCQSLSQSAQKVKKALLDVGLDCEVLELPDSTRTAKEAADAVGCDVGQIIKSLVFMGKNSGEAVLILASGVNRVDEKIISKYLGEKIVKADAEFVRRKTGYAIGGIPPIGHVSPIKTIIDEDLLNYDVLWAAAGTPHAVFKFKSTDLKIISLGEVIGIHK